MRFRHLSFFFFFTDPPTTEIYTFSLHDALPIFNDDLRHRAAGRREHRRAAGHRLNHCQAKGFGPLNREEEDRKSTRLNSSHPSISYAGCCMKKKKKTTPLDR